MGNQNGIYNFILIVYWLEFYCLKSFSEDDCEHLQMQ